MAAIRRPARARYVLAVLVLVSVTLITLDQRGGGKAITTLRDDAHTVTSPIQGAIHDALRPVGNFLTGAANYGTLEKENERLRQQVANMQNQSLAASAEQAEAQRVLAQAHLPFVGSIPTITAQVVNSDASNFESSVTIDKGTSDGVALGQPVVATGGLVGTIVGVTRHSAVLRLLTDPNFVVGVQLGPVVGSAKGTGIGGPMQVTFDQPIQPALSGTQPKFSLAKGNVVVTSGLQGEAFPSGIPVARVASVAHSPNAPAPTVTLTPVVNVSELDIVSVEIWSPQSASTPGGNG
ncbi:MAG: rod shape-determining protein MreC [Acidimicrobiaceae bacterium]|nr:rod shape-determining protein MreC [Acidimicrobiaceae bacterium]